MEFDISQLETGIQGKFSYHFQVNRGDKSTKICGKCICKVNSIGAFRAVCAATNKLLRNTKRQSTKTSGEASADIVAMQNADDDDESASNDTNSEDRESVDDPPVACIPLTDDETDSEAEDASAVAEREREPQMTSIEVTFLNLRETAADLQV